MTKQILVLTLLASTAAFAQYGRYPNRGGYGYGPSNPYSSSQRFIDGIQNDLQRIGQRAAWDGWARRQFSDAVNNLERFQANASRGKFDNGRLDQAIDNLNRLLTARELYPQDKQRIAFHRDQLRTFRANRGIPPRY
ncbi:hypothetical protein [Bryobacter aggregatus]|uniref:hypothetical protein n=1 Tax=Bryobacter aggregatus TaxID=360054 RepID=UPI0004E0D3DC|nr:hypothetical protein [Bryobacter aggregatus]